MHNFWVIVGLWSLHTLQAAAHYNTQLQPSIIYSYTLDMNNYSDTLAELLQELLFCCSTCTMLYPSSMSYVKPRQLSIIKDQYYQNRAKNEQKMGVGNNHIYFSLRAPFQMKRPQGKHGSQHAAQSNWCFVILFLLLSSQIFATIGFIKTQTTRLIQVLTKKVR